MLIGPVHLRLSEDEIVRGSLLVVRSSVPVDRIDRYVTVDFSDIVDASDRWFISLITEPSLCKFLVFFPFQFILDSVLLFEILVKSVVCEKRFKGIVTIDFFQEDRDLRSFCAICWKENLCLSWSYDTFVLKHKLRRFISI